LILVPIASNPGKAGGAIVQGVGHHTDFGLFDGGKFSLEKGVLGHTILLLTFSMWSRQIAFPVESLDCRCRQGEGKGRAHSQLAVDVDVAAVGFDELLGDG